MVRDAVRSIVAILAFTIVCGVAYPAVVWAIGQVAFNSQANGSIVKDPRVSSADSAEIRGTWKSSITCS